MKVFLTIALFLLFSRKCSGRRAHKTIYDTSGLRAYLFGTTSIFNTYFCRSSTNQTFIIKEPSNPIIYDDHRYFWNGYFEKSAETGRVCRQNITGVDNELTQVRFDNGTSPSSLIFECGKWEECCGSKCCNHIQGFLVMMGCIFCLFAVAVGVFYFDC